MTPIPSLAAPYEKLRLAVRQWLLGRRYFMALRAMEFAAKHHTGVRLDGAPEFSHQVWQASYLATIEANLLDPEACFATTFLHDVSRIIPSRFATSTRCSARRSLRASMPSRRS